MSIWKHDFSCLIWPLHNWLIGLARPILIGQRDYSGFARLWRSNKKHLFIKCYPTNYFNREEKSLCQVAIIAKFSDDKKPKTSLKKWIRTVSNFIGLIQFLFYLSNNVGEIFIIIFFLGGGGGFESQRTVSKFKKRKRKFLRCVHLLHKAGAWN